MRYSRVLAWDRECLTCPQQHYRSQYNWHRWRVKMFLTAIEKSLRSLLETQQQWMKRCVYNETPSVMQRLWGIVRWESSYWCWHLVCQEQCWYSSQSLCIHLNLVRVQHCDGPSLNVFKELPHTIRSSAVLIIFQRQLSAPWCVNIHYM